MSSEDGVRDKLFFILVTGCVFQCVNTSPIFFPSPFSAVKMLDGETENVSVYTTTEDTSPYKTGTTENPSVYHQIARNVLERIASPVVSHFILVTATEKPNNIASKSHKTTKDNEKKLEIVEESIPELDEEDFSSVNITEGAVNNGTDELNRRELINPKLIESNPSFNKRITKKQSSRPERIVLYPFVSAVEEEEKIASEVNDLNMGQKDFFDSISDLPDESENEVDPDNIKTRADERTDGVEVDNGKDFGESDRNGGKSFSENGFIYLLEKISSVISLAWGAISAIFPTQMTNMDDGN